MRGLSVIEDACQAPGAVIDGIRSATLGHVGVLSFGGSKLLTAGRGGAILTGDDRIHQRIRLYTQRGNDAYPLSEMQAAVLLPQLRQLDECNQKRFTNVRRLVHSLTASSQNLIEPVIDLDAVSSNDMPVFYKLAWRLVQNGAAASMTDRRDQLIARFKDAGIPIDSAFPALHKIHGRSRFRAVGDLPNASAMHDMLVTLHHPVLLADEPVIDELGQAMIKLLPPES